MGLSHTERRLWALEAAQPKPCVLLPGLDCVPCEPRIPQTRIRGTKDPLDPDQGTINRNQPLPARAVVTEQKAQSMEQKQQ